MNTVQVRQRALYVVGAAATLGVAAAIPVSPRVAVGSAIGSAVFGGAVAYSWRRAPAEAAAIGALALASIVDLPRRLSVGSFTGGAFVTTLTLLTVLAGWLVTPRVLTRPCERQTLPIAVFLAAAGISFLHFAPTIGGVQNVLVWLAFYFVITLVGASVVARPAFAARISKTHFAFCSWTGFALYSLSLALGGLGAGGVLAPRSFALFALIPICWGLSRPASARIHGLVVAGVGTALIFLSLSRLATFAAFLLWGIATLRPGPFWGYARPLAAVAIATTMLFAAIQYVRPLHDRFVKGEIYRVSAGSGATIPLNLEGRLELWRATYQSFKTSPWIGHGAGSSETLITKLFGKEAGHPHSDYLRLMHDYGVVGLALWLLAWLSLLRQTFSGWRQASLSSPARSDHKAASLALIALAIGMATDNAMVYPFVMVPLGVLVGLSLGQRTLELRPPNSR